MHIDQIPLNRLSVSKANMRAGKKPPDISDILPSIIKRGVISPLFVRPNCSAGHFEIYNHVVTAFEQASGDKLELAKRIYPHIRACTEFALEFNDKYSNADEAQLLQLDEDLNQLGPVLEDRFKQEDRLVKALQVVESLSHQRV